MRTSFFLAFFKKNEIKASTGPGARLNANILKHPQLICDPKCGHQMKADSCE